MNSPTSGREFSFGEPHMAAKKKLVVIGLLGSVLDRGNRADRWGRWRPSVALANQSDLRIDRFELIHQPNDQKLAHLISEDIATIAPETDVRLHPVEWSDPWDFPEVYAHLHDFARGYRFRPDREEYLIHITTGTHVAQICLFLLTEARYFPGRLIQCSPRSEGAASNRRGRGSEKQATESARTGKVRAKERDISGSHRVIDLDLSRYDNIASRFRQEQRDGVDYLKSGIATRNQAFNALIAEMERVAIHSRAPILLAGPTGAGKSQLARRLFELKKLRGQVTGKFVEVNCATLRGDGAMSALFGHTKGAFTGAAAARAGLLREANNGILFLDEIGELGRDEQAMLLRALEEKRFLPLGADREVESKFQLIAGSNRDLPKRVGAGQFREDLLARINLWTYSLPALRRRPEDIEPNLEYEIEQFARKEGRMVRFSREARALYLDFARSPEASWPANFRDLNASVTRMATLSPGGRIDLATVRAELARLRARWQGRLDDLTGISRAADDGGHSGQHGDAGDPLKGLLATAHEDIDAFDLVQLRHVVRVCRSEANLAAAGRKLFAVSRKGMKTKNDSDRLRKYLARFGLSWDQIRMSGTRS